MPKFSPACGFFTPVGGEWVKHATRRLSDRPVWRHAAVAEHERPEAHAYAQAARVSAPGAECSSSTVPGGFQHASLSQPCPTCHGWQEAAVGLHELRPRARLPQLGLPPREGESSGWWRARVPHVQEGGTVCAPVAGLWRRPLSWRRTADARLLPLRSRVLGEDGTRLEPDPTATRNTCLSCSMPFLRHVAHWAERPRQAYLPGTRWLRVNVQEEWECYKELKMKKGSRAWGNV